MRLSSELRRLRKEVDDLQRRLVVSQMTGRVAEVDGKRVRVQLAPAGPSGKPFLSPWIQVREAAGGGKGGVSTHRPIKVGEPMRVFSPTGELGPASIAERDSYTEDSPRPTDDDDELVLADYAGARLTSKGGDVTIECPGTITLKGAEIVTDGTTRLNRGERRVVFEGSIDSDGDTNIQGAEGVFV